MNVFPAVLASLTLLTPAGLSRLLDDFRVKIDLEFRTFQDGKVMLR